MPHRSDIPLASSGIMGNLRSSNIWGGLISQVVLTVKTYQVGSASVRTTGISVGATEVQGCGFLSGPLGAE